MCPNECVHSIVDGHLGYLQFVIIGRAARNTGTPTHTYFLWETLCPGVEPLGYIACVAFHNFNLYLPGYQWYWALFHMLLLLISFRPLVMRLFKFLPSFLFTVFLLLICRCSEYKPFVSYSVANIFSHPVVCLFRSGRDGLKLM